MFPRFYGACRIGLAVYPKNPRIIYAVVDNQERKADSAFQRRDTAKDGSGLYIAKDFKDINKEGFMALDNKKLDTFFKYNGIPEKYTAAGVKEMVQQEKLKPTVIWDYLFDANPALLDPPVLGAEVYRSDDGGMSWSKTNQKRLSLYNTYGYYFGKIYVSPVNENKVVLTGIDNELSTDGGKTFMGISKENVHADNHALWIDPSHDSHMINGNDGGCNITYDDGRHWFKANTPPVGQFYAIDVDMAQPYNVYGGLQDNGTWYGPSTNTDNYGWYNDGEYAFRGINGGDGMQVQVDRRDNKTVYSGFQFGNYSRRNKDASQAPGERQVRIHPVNDLGEDLPNEPINVVREDTKFVNIIYVGTDGGVYLSIDGGDNFMTWTNGLPKSVPVHDMVIHPRDNELILATHGRSIYIASLDKVQQLLKKTTNF